MLELNNIKSILFVCLGNICRSPIAKGVANKISQDNGLDIIADSAGTGSWHIGEAPCANSQKVSLMNGINISSYRARQINKDDFNKFDLIVALDSNNYIDLQNLGCKKIVKLGSFGYSGADVPDPYFYNDFDGFIKVYNMIYNSIKKMLLEIDQKN